MASVEDVRAGQTAFRESNVEPQTQGSRAIDLVTSQDPLLGRLLFPVAALLCLSPWLTPPLALGMGLVMALLVGHPYGRVSRVGAKWLLQISVVALGFGMNLHAVAKAGLQGFGLAAASITLTWLAGMLLGRLLRVPRMTTLLICAGTAICGGSAIAAVGSVVLAGEAEMSVALGTVFLLNALALYLFPLLGHVLGLSQTQFGTWAGVAIHDISSVVGASTVYGHHALQVATAVKLSRALWIIPVSLMAALWFHNGRAEHDTAAVESGGNKSTPRFKVSIPWFIALFLLASLARSTIAPIAAWAPLITHGAEKALTLTLFLIGAGLARHTLKAVGVRPLVLGVLLWGGISLGSLLAIQYWVA